MKNSTFLFIIVLLSSSVSIAQVRLGLTGGIQLANLIAKDATDNYTASNKVGFQAGIMMDKVITGNLSIRPQLLFSTKGTKTDPSDVGFGLGSAESSVILNYLEIPIQFMYGIEAGPGQLILGAGPYMAYGISGKSTYTLAGDSQSEPVKFGLSEDQVKRIDFGLRLSAGYELTSGLSVSAFYSPGLSNLSNELKTTAKNTAFGVSLGFLFGER